ncbi:Uncharacterized protein Adt_25371 [Abeliophyllum distichum]|uniref:Reverse transcriptase domain-containing protein n=1 Tax=Abeliophyllum distichum TaxID=126358 RepID=A0ABD1SGF5_9LAMI
MRVGIAEMYLKRKVDVWFHGFQSSHPNADWGLLTTEVCRRFAKTTGEEVVETFCKIRQYGEIAEYVEKFEELKAQAMQALPNLHESYYISVFTSGLKGEIKSVVKIIKPSSLNQVIEIALLQETTISAISKNTKTHESYIHPKPPESLHTETKRPNPHFPYKTLTPIGLQTKRNLGLCFKCDEKYTIGHVLGTELINGSQLESILVQQPYGLVGQLNPILEKEVTETPKELKSILAEFDDVFQEPNGLPPKTLHDHHIPLKEGTQPFQIKPYRCPFIQKSEVEKLIEEMLATGIIQPSNSPFASLVLLVKKNDGTWRFCVDYRQLNNLTVKDKHPMSLTDELIDELYGANYFTKIDLRAGYHQISVKTGDVYKTALKTHQGLYEFKVMPFGLTNAPATFQSLMNEIFKEQLRKNVLIFLMTYWYIART